MSKDKNDLFDDDLELNLDDEEVDFDDSDFDEEEEELDQEFDDVEEDIDDFDEDMLEEDLSVFDIDVDVDDDDLEDDEDSEESDEDTESDEEEDNSEDKDASDDKNDEAKGLAVVAGETTDEKADSETKENSDEEKEKTAEAEEIAASEASETSEEKPKKKKKKALIVVLSILGVLLLAAGFFLGTSTGRKMIYSFAAKYLHGNLDYVEGKKNDLGSFVLKIPTPTPIVTQSPDITDIPNDDPVATPTPVVDEIYAKNYLLFGIEEIGGAANTDSIMVLTINQRDKSLKFTSLLRDTYVEIPGTYPNKINSAYAFGMKQGDTVSEMKYYGGMKLIEVIENTYDIKIEGFACVNFKALESIIDRLGGVDIELGNSEASYLRRTNYISNPAYRTVQAGWNHLNGNQALGYCRVRKVVTLGGANNDYGRTVRQRRVIHAIVEAYKSKGITELLPILTDCLSYITTNMTAEQITDIFTDVVENGIFNFEENRIPYDGMFRDSGKTGIFNGRYNVTYGLVIDDYRDQIIEKLHAFMYNDPTAVTDEEDAELTDSEVTGAPSNDASVTPAPAY